MKLTPAQRYSDLSGLRSRRLISRSMASRMNSALRFFPAISSIFSAVPSGRRTRIGFTFIGGRPMRAGVFDIGNAVNFPTLDQIKRYRLLTLYPISVISSITNWIGAKQMANFRYFNGETELKGVYYESRKIAFGTPVDFTPRWIEAEKRWDRGYVRVERAIEYKSSPSRHECDARCYNATGKIMRCECSCGGKNHGLGAFRCSEAA